MQFKPTARAVAFRSFEVNLDFDAKFRRDEPDVPDRRATEKQAKRSSGKKVSWVAKKSFEISKFKLKISKF